MMNEQSVNPVPPARGGQGGRGRGGTPRPGKTQAAAKAAQSKIGPGRALEHDWVDESVLKGQSFVVWLGSGKSGARQVTIHRPIGGTSLDKTTTWVATPSDEIHYLLARLKSEALSRWERERDVAVRSAVLLAGTGRRMNQATPPQEVWAFNGSPPIGPTIQAAMAAAKAAGGKESEWVNHATEAVRAAELQFKQALRNAEPAQAWLADHPQPRHETRGGPLGDRPQSAVSYLTGRSLAAAQDLVLNRIFGVGAT